jgi:uncharacterized protein (TIGR02996 family)
MSVKTQREMLEAAIAADFDDLAAHAAYADCLAEEGDPRGEYIQLRLALENEDQPHRLLQDWRERASRLYQQYERDWLGSLAPFLLGRSRTTVEPVSPNIEFTFRRGWLAELHVQDVRDAFTIVLAGAQEARMLQALSLRNTRLPNNRWPLEPLLASPYLSGLKSFSLGDPEAFQCTADGALVPELVRRLPRLHELEVRAARPDAAAMFSIPLPELRVFTADYLSEHFPLAALARNEHLGQLERLFLSVRDPGPPPGSDEDVDFLLTLETPAEFAREHFGPFLRAPQFARLTDVTIRFEILGDAGCEAIARSGILGRLRRLDLRQCGITDAGAEALARSADLGRLEWLDVGGNRLTPAGVARLQEADIRVQWDSQWDELLGPDEGEDVIV